MRVYMRAYFSLKYHLPCGLLTLQTILLWTGLPLALLVALGSKVDLDLGIEELHYHYHYHYYFFLYRYILLYQFGRGKLNESIRLSM